MQTKLCFAVFSLYVPYKHRSRKIYEVSTDAIRTPSELHVDVLSSSRATCQPDVSIFMTENQHPTMIGYYGLYHDAWQIRRMNRHLLISLS